MLFFQHFFIYLCYTGLGISMRIKDKNINIEEAMRFANQKKLLLNHYDNGILLSDYQVDVLRNNGLDFRKYGSMQDLLFDLEEYLNNEYDEELDLISNQIAELIYYHDTKK